MRVIMATPRSAVPSFSLNPKDHGREILAYLRDPDSHLMEVGQVTGLLD
jgi:hypothetical protein